uniref:Uncharacterized protein n=1 Tax=Glossina pallidipes TaxID=7398 RepID=A0A1A9Z894_GLOPL
MFWFFKAWHRIKPEQTRGLGLLFAKPRVEVNANNSSEASLHFPHSSKAKRAHTIWESLVVSYFRLQLTKTQNSWDFEKSHIMFRIGVNHEEEKLMQFILPLNMEMDGDAIKFEKSYANL